MSRRHFLILLLCVLFSFQLVGQQLTHHMTEEEKGKMPDYLSSADVRAVTAAPPVVVRNIAEFEAMQGVLIAYPLGIPVSLVAEMSEDDVVVTIVDDLAEENTVRSVYSSAGVTMANCNFIYAPHDSYWTRDYGPWYIADGNRNISITDFTYNRPRANDNNIPSAMATYLGIDLYEMDLVQTGGNYMTDGMGISVSTDLVWEENTNYTAIQINQIMSDYLGISTYHVVADPLDDYIKHVDCWGKYLDTDKILIGRVPSSDSRYQDYENTATYFANQTTSYGNNYQVYRVDSPDGQPYTNSLILNKRVFVPITGSSEDAAALAVYTTAMPGYEVLGFTGSWMSTDALHCRAKGIADTGMLYIHHLPLLGEKPQQSQYTISADIIPYSGMTITSGSVKIYYQVDGGSFNTVTMSLSSGDTYTGNIPSQAQGSDVGYYIQAADGSGRVSEHPFIGSPDPHVFTVGSPLQTPVAQFSADSTTVMEGNSVQFTDLSNNYPDTWSWSFPGGTPSTSTAQNPTVTYSSQGSYTVTLTATNAAGNDTETKVDYITVQSASACLGDITNPGFETGSTSGWTTSGTVSISSTSHTGSYGIAVVGTGSQVEQVVTGLCPNTTYVVSAWGLARSNSGFFLGVKDFGGSTMTAQFTDSRTWRQKTITFTTGASNTSATIYFTKTTSKFTGNGDDFELALY